MLHFSSVFFSLRTIPRVSPRMLRPRTQMAECRLVLAISRSFIWNGMWKSKFPGSNEYPNGATYLDRCDNADPYPQPRGNIKTRRKDPPQTAPLQYSKFLRWSYQTIYTPRASRFSIATVKPFTISSIFINGSLPCCSEYGT